MWYLKLHLWLLLMIYPCLYMYIINMHLHLCMKIIQVTTSSHYTCWCYVLIATSSCGDLLLSPFICCSYFLLICSYDELVSLCGLEGTCFVTNLGVVTPNDFVLPFINFWGQTSSLDFIFCYDPSLVSNLFFLFSMVCGDPIKAPLNYSKPIVKFLFCPFLVSFEFSSL